MAPLDYPKDFDLEAQTPLQKLWSSEVRLADKIMVAVAFILAIVLTLVVLCVAVIGTGIALVVFTIIFGNVINILSIEVLKLLGFHVTP